MVAGSTASYTLERKGEVYSCTCPAWRNQSAPIRERTCKHLRAYLGESEERGRTGTVASAPRVASRPSWVPPPKEEREERERRRAVVAEAVAAFPILFDKMLLVYGLRMPKHLAYSIGFYLALNEDEREEAWGLVGTGPAGIGEWFEERALARPVLPGLDERLEFRFRRDPPEFVSVFSGNSDGGHWGLWYDDPGELPRTIAHNWARDSAETYERRPTLLATFRDELYGEHSQPIEDLSQRGANILAWLDDCYTHELEAFREEAIAPFAKRPYVVGGLGAWVPGWSPPSDIPDHDARYQRYRDSDPMVGEWITRAQRELAAGAPGLALMVGRDLHWFDDDATRAVCTELLVGGYRALGRDAIAEIVRVHHEHRDLAQVNVYGERQLSPLERAMAENDVDAARALLDAGQRDLPHLHTAGPMLDLLLPHATPKQLDDAMLWMVRQYEFFSPMEGVPERSELRAPYEAGLSTLFARGVSASVLQALLAAGNEEVVLRAIAHADLTSRTDAGRTALHLVCRRGHVAGARTLLDRGADGRAVDAANETPHDAIKHAWIDHRKEAEELYALFRGKGLAPAPKPAAPASEEVFKDGDRVTHAQYGDGVIKVSLGRGPTAKLTIQFASGMKTIAAKFIKRR